MDEKKNYSFVFKPKFSKNVKIALCNAIILARTKKQDVVLYYKGAQIKVTPNINISIGHIVNSFFSSSENQQIR
ncbi:MAG: hypothetical protein J6S57_03430 [Alphaproteobacteria bacterium]|nr:hypothetical protein [Alphaproteobacteria bacterium]